MKRKNSKKLIVVQSEYYIPTLEEKLKKFIICCVPCILSEKKLGKKEGSQKEIDL